MAGFEYSPMLANWVRPVFTLSEMLGPALSWRGAKVAATDGMVSLGLLVKSGPTYWMAILPDSSKRSSMRIIESWAATAVG